MFPSRTLRSIVPSLIISAILLPSLAYSDTWQGLTVAPERRCTPYRREDYPRPRA